MSYLAVLDIVDGSVLSGRYVSLKDPSEGDISCTVAVGWPTT